MPTRSRWSADAARELQITSWETKIKDVKLPRRRNTTNLTVTAYGPTDRCNNCRGLGGAHSGQGRAPTTASRTCDRSWSPEAGQPRRSERQWCQPPRLRQLGRTSGETPSRPNPRKTTSRTLAVKLDIKAKRMTLSDAVSMVAGERVRTR